MNGQLIKLFSNRYLKIKLFSLKDQTEKRKKKIGILDILDILDVLVIFSALKETKWFVSSSFWMAIHSLASFIHWFIRSVGFSISFRSIFGCLPFGFFLVSCRSFFYWFQFLTRFFLGGILVIFWSIFVFGFGFWFISVSFRSFSVLNLFLLDHFGYFFLVDFKFGVLGQFGSFWSVCDWIQFWS